MGLQKMGKAKAANRPRKAGFEALIFPDLYSAPKPQSPNRIRILSPARPALRNRLPSPPPLQKGAGRDRRPEKRRRPRGDWRINPKLREARSSGGRIFPRRREKIFPRSPLGIILTIMDTNILFVRETEEG